MDGLTDLEILRMVLARELDTVNEYTALARRAQDPAVRDLLLHIGAEEEEHIAECIQWIARLSPVMAGFLERAPDHIRQGATPGGAEVGREPGPRLEAAPAGPVRPEGVEPPVLVPAVPASEASTAPLIQPLTVSAGPLRSSTGTGRGPAVSSPSIPAGAPVRMAAPMGGQLLSPPGLTVGSLLNQPMEYDR